MMLNASAATGDTVFGLWALHFYKKVLLIAVLHNRLKTAQFHSSTLIPKNKQPKLRVRLCGTPTKPDAPGAPCLLRHAVPLSSLPCSNTLKVPDQLLILAVPPCPRSPPLTDCLLINRCLKFRWQVPGTDPAARTP